MVTKHQFERMNGFPNNLPWGDGMERRETVRRVFEKSLFAPCTPGLECKLVNHRLQCVERVQGPWCEYEPGHDGKAVLEKLAPTYKCVKESGLSNMELVSELCYAPTIAVMTSRREKSSACLLTRTGSAT